MSQYIVKARHSRKGERIFPQQPTGFARLFAEPLSKKVATPQRTIRGEPLTAWVKRVPHANIESLDRFSTLQIVQRLMNSPDIDRIVISKVRE